MSIFYFLSYHLQIFTRVTSWPVAKPHWVRFVIVPLGGPQGPGRYPQGGLMAKSLIFGPIFLKFSPGLHIRKSLKDFA